MMHDIKKIELLTKAEKVFDDPIADDTIRTIAHLFPHMIPVLHEAEHDKYVLFFDIGTKVNITVALDE